jgi:hypothetical protein
MMGMSPLSIYTSGVWEAVGVAAKGVIVGYLHSSGVSHLLSISHFLGILAICLPLEAESSFCG